MEGETVKERVVNPTKIQIRKAVDGGLAFSYINRRGDVEKIESYGSCLIDELRRALFPLENFKETLWREDGNDPGAMYFLLQKLVEDAFDRLSDIADVIEEDIGGITVYGYERVGPLRGKILGASIQKMKA